MKGAEIKALHLLKKGGRAEIKGWIKARRKHKGIIFLDIADSTGEIQAVLKTPFWVSGIPCQIEPFPYEPDPSNTKVTRVADLLLPEGYGELLGVAQKISDKEKLMKRIKDKGLMSKYARYKWYAELRDYGCVVHSGFGMGAERFLRWFMKSVHVRNTIPFPRMFKRIPYP